MLQDTWPACAPPLPAASWARAPACSNGWLQGNRAQTACRRKAARRRASTGALPRSAKSPASNLIGKDNPFRGSAKLKFCVGQNHSAGFGVLRRPACKLPASGGAVPRRRDRPAGLRRGEGDVLVVRAVLALGGGRKQRLRQPRSILEAGGKRNAAHGFRRPGIPSSPTRPGSRAPRTQRETWLARCTSMERPSNWSA
jgi:hypothetical protein